MSQKTTDKNVAMSQEAYAAIEEAGDAFKDLLMRLSELRMKRRGGTTISKEDVQSARDKVADVISTSVLLIDEDC